MRLALVALPWSDLKRPSAAIGALAAYTRQHAPAIETTCFYAYVEAAARIGLGCYTQIVHMAYETGELLYCPLLYPEKRDEVLAAVTPQLKKLARQSAPRARDPLLDFVDRQRDLGAEVLAGLDAHLDELVETIAANHDVVGLTTVFGQLFANLAFAKRLKARAPNIRIILGGSTVSVAVGPALLREYPFLDYVIQGEGERPLVALLERLASGETSAAGLPATLDRATAGELPDGAGLHEVQSLDALPIPDYGAYAEVAAQYGFAWSIPIEGSRGCWWDRTKRTGNPKSTCHFCNLNVQWNGYREKSAARIVDEVRTLVGRHATSNLFFLDNIVRSKGIPELADGLLETGLDLKIFYEMRANVSPYDVLRLWEAGLDFVQFGIEALSTSYLQRMGKGTSTIQNLQAMKTCYELGIFNGANLLIGFPGATQAEVDETCATIRDYAYIYQPLSPCPFFLGIGSTVDTMTETFPITNVRNRDFLRTGVPAEVYERMTFFDKSFDYAEGAVSWEEVMKMCGWWASMHASSNVAFPRQHRLCYYDGGDFVRIASQSVLRDVAYVVRGAERDLYMYIMEIRRFDEIVRHLRGAMTAEEIQDSLDRLGADHLVFREGNRYLAIAPAHRPEVAARRIRRQHEQDALTKSSALRVVG